MKKLDLPPDVARSFVEDMRAYFAEPNAIKRDEIAGRQLRALRRYTPRWKKLRITDVIEMFVEMKDHCKARGRLEMTVEWPVRILSWASEAVLDE